MSWEDMTDEDREAEAKAEADAENAWLRAAEAPDHESEHDLLEHSMMMEFYR